MCFNLRDDHDMSCGRIDAVGRYPAAPEPDWTETHLGLNSSEPGCIGTQNPDLSWRSRVSMESVSRLGQYTEATTTWHRPEPMSNKKDPSNSPPPHKQVMKLPHLHAVPLVLPARPAARGFAPVRSGGATSSTERQNKAEIRHKNLSGQNHTVHE